MIVVQGPPHAQVSLLGSVDVMAVRGGGTSWCLRWWRHVGSCPGYERLSGLRIGLGRD